MNDDTPRPIPTWREFLSAQTGRWFFARWMLAGLVMAFIATADMAMRFRHYLVPEWAFYLPIATALYGICQGWVLFRWQWRTWAWTAARMAMWVSVVFFCTEEVPRHLTYLLLGVVQMLLWFGVRRRPPCWLIASQAGYELSMLLYSIPWSRLDILRGQLAVIEQFIDSVGPSICITGVATLLDFVITGITLAWLMPPAKIPDTVG